MDGCNITIFSTVQAGLLDDVYVHTQKKEEFERNVLRERTNLWAPAKSDMKEISQPMIIRINKKGSQRLGWVLQ